MITEKLFNSIFPIKGLSPKKYNLVRFRTELIDALNKHLPRYEINNHARVTAFLGNCGIETDYFKTTEEYASGADYEWRKSLGNTKKGDGRRFKGRGLTQTTGRYNYSVLNKTVGKRLGIDFLAQPERLNQIEIAVESACIFWQEHDLNAYADRGQFKQLSAIVNRGDKNKTPLHWAKRNELYSLCKRRVPRDLAFAPAQNPIVTTVTGYSSYTTQVAVSPEPVVLTPTNTDAPTATVPASEPAKDDSFLNAALDKNLSADEAKEMAKTALPSLGTRLWKFIARPLLWIYTALEAGNVAAWLGVIVVIGIVIYIIYLNRVALKQALNTVKNKFTQ